MALLCGIDRLHRALVRSILLGSAPFHPAISGSTAFVGFLGSMLEFESRNGVFVEAQLRGSN
jgi:hypothetical protein